MQVSFGKFVPVIVRIKTSDKEVREASPEERADVTNMLCAQLRNSAHSKDDLLVEQQRRFFARLANDYKLATKTFKKGETDGSNVTPVNIKDCGRFLVTGQDIDYINKLGAEFNRNTNTIDYSQDYIQTGLTEEITDQNIRLYNAKRKRQQGLREALKDRRLDRTLYVKASLVPGKSEKDKIKDRYHIDLVDLVDFQPHQKSS